MRLTSVLDGRLDRDYVCGEYSIADIALYPWFAAAQEKMPEALAGAKRVKAWLERMGERPAVKLGMDLKSNAGDR